MILTTDSGDKYRLHFRHWFNPEAPQKPVHQPLKMSGLPNARELNATSCAIHLGDCVGKGRPCGTPGTEVGHAECSVQDTFNRAKGRRVAFSRAIRAFPKHVRQQLWRQWLKSYPPGSIQRITGVDDLKTRDVA